MVESLLAILYTVLLYAFLVWVLLFAIQLSDLFANLLDLRGAHDFRLRNREATRRVTEYIWSIPVGLTLFLGFFLGIEYAGHLLFDLGYVRDGIIAASVLLFVAFGAGIAIIYLLSRSQKPSYATLRATLQDEGIHRLTRSQIEALRAQLVLIDSTQRHIRLGIGDSARMRRTRAELKGISDRFRAVPPSGLRAMNEIGWPYAWAYLWRGNFLRVVPPLLALVIFIFSIVVIVIEGSWISWWLPTSLLVAFVVSSLLALVTARASLASKAAWHAVYLKQRTEVEDILIELEKASRKGVNGLGDRVSRALQILREQQQ
jgi:hypothetical protein